MLAFSIIICLALTGRCLYVVFMVFYRSAADISNNVEYYQQGQLRVKQTMRRFIEHLHWPNLDFELVVDEMINFMKIGASLVTENVLYAMVQCMFTLIFALYMLWS